MFDDKLKKRCDIFSKPSYTNSGFFDFMFWIIKKHKISKYNKIAKEHFSITMSAIKIMLTTDITKISDKDSLNILQSVKQTISVDFQYDALSDVLYRKKHDAIDIPPFDFFPINIEKHFRGKSTVDFSQNIIVSIPHKLDSYLLSAKYIYPNSFVKHHHSITWYSGIDIGYIVEGRHSGTMGIIKNEGYAEANVYDVTPLFSTVYTDGAYWYNSATNSIIRPVYDFRLAVLFEISKMQYEIKKHSHERSKE